MANPNQLAFEGIRISEEDEQENGITRRQLLLASLAVLAAGTSIVLGSCGKGDQDISGSSYSADVRRRVERFRDHR